jgi:hypothetical protein
MKVELWKKNVKLCENRKSDCVVKVRLWMKVELMEEKCQSVRKKKVRLCGENHIDGMKVRLRVVRVR